MIIAFFALIFMVVSFAFFYASIGVNALDRAVLYFPIEIIQKGVNIIEVDSEEDLYFDRTIITNEVNSYFDRTITKYVISYETSIIFTNKDNTMVCLGLYSKCQGVKINLQAELYFDIHYEKTMFYSIGER